MSNKSASYHFRSEVLLYLMGQGVNARPARELRLSERSGEIPAGSIRGIEPWLVHTHSKQELDLSADVSAAEVDASTARTPWYATINRRKSKSAEDAYVTMPLSVFTRILKGESPQLIAQADA